MPLIFCRLSLYRSLHSLVHVSTSGIVVAVLFASLGVMLAVDTALQGSVDDVNWGFSMHREDSSLRDMLIHVCSAMSTFVFAYYTNPEIPPLVSVFM